MINTFLFIVYIRPCIGRFRAFFTHYFINFWRQHFFPLGIAHGQLVVIARVVIRIFIFILLLCM